MSVFNIQEEARTIKEYFSKYNRELIRIIINIQDEKHNNRIRITGILYFFILYININAPKNNYA